jgi:PleD family two-component response regulator
VTSDQSADRGQYKILVVDDDPDIRNLVCTYLEIEGFRIEEAKDGVEAVSKAFENRPDLILLDIMMPNKSGTEVLSELRADFRTAFVPVVFLTAKSLVGDKVGHLLGGADDYIVKPFDPQELVARVEVALRRSAALRGLNPLSGLPGNTVIAEELTRRLSEGTPFACLYVDLDNFKAYNDAYGFSRGDDVIRMLGNELLVALERHPTPGRFVGHVGGDDFVVLTPPDQAEEVAKEIVGRFDKEILGFYEEEARERGWIEVKDRRGNRTRFPLCSVSAARLTRPSLSRSRAFVRVPVGRPPGARLAGVQYAGCRPLYGRPRGSLGTLWPTGDLAHRSGRLIHQ